MAKNKTGLLLTVAGIGVVAAAAVLIGTGRVNLPMPGGGAARRASGASQIVQRFLDEEREVIAEIGKHPDSERVFDQLVATWSDATGRDAGSVRREIVLAFPDHNLGLYALRAFLGDGATPGQEARAFCRTLVDEHGDTRVACMALDHLLKAAPEEGATLCDGLAAGPPDSRVARFALVRAGDRHAEHDEAESAIIAWLKAWIAQPDMGAKLYNKLCGLWLKQGDWLAPLLIGSEYIDDPALNPLKERLLRYYEGGVDGPQQAGLRTRIGAALAANDVAAFCGVIESARDEWRDMDLSDADKADLALGVFLLGSPSEHTFSLPPGSALALENRFNTCRQWALARGRESCDGLSPDLVAFYTLRVADRMVQGIRVKDALDLLEDSWKKDGVSRVWRERLLSRFADIVSAEYDQPYRTAKLYVDYCDAYGDAPDSFLQKAALLYMQSERYGEAAELFTRLEQRADSDYEKALACFMLGMVMVHTDEPVNAQERFTSVVEHYAATDFAPQALAQLGILALKADETDGAQEYFRQIALRYPEWKHADYYERMAASLDEDKT
ncbi:MAG: hypothetical protein JXR94_04245 [Candidatus Hydrogenedentes bacterium]|nr:hypothetical protein [Candidatus Hydrogenedentota bacterium]